MLGCRDVYQGESSNVFTFYKYNIMIKIYTQRGQHSKLGPNQEPISVNIYLKKSYISIHPNYFILHFEHT